MAEHFCEHVSPVARRFGLPQPNGKVLVSPVLHEDGVRCFNPRYLRDLQPTKPWGDRAPKEV